MRVDELVDGLIDPNAAEDIEALAENEELDDLEEDEDEEDGGGGAVSASLLQLKIRRAGALRAIRGLYGKDAGRPCQEGPREQGLPEGQQQISAELMNIRFTARIIERLCDSGAQHGRGRAQPRAQDPGAVRQEGQHAAPALHQGLPRQRDQPRMAQARSHRRQALRLHADAHAPAVIEEQQKLIDLQNRIGIPLRTSRTSTSRCPPARPRPAAPSAR
jgi:RNA polymerase primary sigma factor